MSHLGCGRARSRQLRLLRPTFRKHLGAKCTSAGGERNLSETGRALCLGRCFVRVKAQCATQGIEWLHHEEEDDCGNHDERNHGVEDFAVVEGTLIDVKCEILEALVAGNGGDDWREQSLNDGVHDPSERGTDGDTDCEIDCVGPQSKRSKLFQDGLGLLHN